MRPSGQTRNSGRNSKMSPIPRVGPSAPFERDLGIFGSIGGDGQGDGGGKADNDLSTDRQRLVVPRVADIGLEDLATLGLDVIPEGAAEVGEEAHTAAHRVATVRWGRADGDILGADGQHAPVADGSARDGAEPAERGVHDQLAAGALADPPGDEVVGADEVPEEARARALV